MQITFLKDDNRCKVVFLFRYEVIEIDYRELEDISLSVLSEKIKKRSINRRSIFELDSAIKTFSKSVA